MDNLYESRRLKNLFNEMSATYGWVNLVASFGVTFLWRRQCMKLVRVEPKDTIYDLMSGMGEVLDQLKNPNQFQGNVVCVDFSKAMCDLAKRNVRLKKMSAQILEEDVLNYPFPGGQADVVLSSFGLKTFSVEQTKRLGQVVFNLLKEGGQFSFIEISVPKNRILKFFFLFYLHKIIPVIGRVFLGNPDNYRQLGIYTESFGSCHQVVTHFQEAGLETAAQSYFFGCATLLVGTKPKSSL